AEVHVEKSHSRIITNLINDLVSFAGHNLNDLKAVAVGKGPGSYTGLRIGVSTAKGLCYGLDIPLIAINTLESMGLGMSKYYQADNHFLCPMIDARRMEVYCAVYDSKMNEIQNTRALIIEEGSFEAILSQSKVVFFGDGSGKCRNLLSSDNAVFVEEIHPSAKDIGSLAIEKFEKGIFEHLAYFEPFYLKDFVSTGKMIRENGK
ncbi:MAG: tRNA (adenosine(37)-N6)-threonylcarbamoyltransferase complex dimerization subunit type 1 TsaB, partial [Cytophagaceae bacterium]